jgi:putative transferase (TIGR04331 family)
MSRTRADSNERVFLATTALEEFWDTTKPIVFLGEWCLLYARRSFWEPLGGRLLKSPLDTSEAARAAYRYVNGIYERILPLLGDVLNAVHGTRHGRRYWRIVLGPWLLFYLPVCYDRYSHLKRALEQYPDCTTTALSESSFATPSDTLDFYYLAHEDCFNLQIYTKIFAALGKTFPSKGAKVARSFAYGEPIAGCSWRRKAAVQIARIYARVGAKARPAIWLRASLFSKLSEFQLSTRTAGKVLPIWGNSSGPDLLEIDRDVRKNLQNLRLGDGEFERCLAAMLFLDMPKCFVEGYGSVGGEARKRYPQKARAIFSANAWYFDEAFKQWAAASAENGALLIGTPHGGNYGGMAIMPSEDHETAIVDRYYSWGWERTGCAADVVPFPASKLVGRKKIGASNLKTGMLWVITEFPRYPIEFLSLPKHYNEYPLWQARFARTLLRKTVPAVRLRPHRDGDPEIVQRLRECIPEAAIETWDVPFQESLANCRLYVCDHLSTTFAEALSANQPTILFWNPQSYEFRPEARPYYDLLRENGILFDTPESAGAAVNRIYNDVEAWWNDLGRQDAVERFCERFARNSPDAIELWVAEFNRIANAALPDN